MTEEELGHLKSQLPGLPVGWECAVADLIDEVRRLKQSADNYRIASLGMFDPVRVGQVVAQLQMERDEAQAEVERLRMALTEAAAETMKVMGQRDRLQAEVKLLEEALTDALKTRRLGRVPDGSIEP